MMNLNAGVKLRVMVLTLILGSIAISSVAQDKYYFVVSQDGAGDFTSIQKAVDACKAYPDQRVTIFVKNGIYKEKVVIPGCNTKLSIVGESTEKTILTWDDFFNKINRGRNSTFYTYTLKVEADDFVLENMTIENSAGPVGQAVALHLEGDRAIIRNCRMLGNQDTLYLAGKLSRDYFEDCYIEGTTDFIFGEATAYFEKCTLHSKGDSFLTAASTPAGRNFGYVFNACKITAAEGVSKVFLGRPWRSFAAVAFIKCEMGPFIRAEGWDNWSNAENEKTARFAEFGNIGDGASLDKRVTWSTKLSAKEAAKYNRENILGQNASSENSETTWYEFRTQLPAK